MGTLETANFKIYFQETFWPMVPNNWLIFGTTNLDDGTNSLGSRWGSLIGTGRKTRFLKRPELWTRFHFGGKAFGQGQGKGKTIGLEAKKRNSQLAICSTRRIKFFGITGIHRD